MTQEERQLSIKKIETFCNLHRCIRCPLDKWEQDGPGCSLDETWTDDMITAAVRELDNQPTPTKEETMMDMVDAFCATIEFCENCPLEGLDCSATADTEEEYQELVQCLEAIEMWRLQQRRSNDR